MSLYIGNLSSRIRGDELERIFRRFGRCRIQVKDRYGFAVYNYPACAEKALKALQGTRICGEALTLSWSNHQPHAAPKFGPGGRSYKPPRRKYSAPENAGRRLGIKDQQDYDMGSKQADAGRTYGSSDLVDKPTSYPPNDAERDHTSPKNHLEDDRWAEQVDPSNESYLENGIEFDRYDPDQSAGVKELDEHQTISSLAGSPSIRKSEERAENTSRRYSVNCYFCGELGHKMHNCPLKAKGQMSRSHGRIVPRGNAVPSRFKESENEPSTSRNRRKLPEYREDKETKDKKRNRRDFQSTDKNHLERKSGASPSSHSDHTSLRLPSTSRSIKSLPRSPSRPKLNLAPSNKNSLAPSLSPLSCRSGSEPLKSHSISRSTSPTSLSLPLEPPPMSNAVGLSSNRNSVEQETLLRSGTVSSKSQHTTSEKDVEPRHFITEDSGEISEPYVARADGDGHIHVNLSPHHVNDPGDSEHEGPVGGHTLVLESERFENRGDLPLEEICTVLKHYGLPYPEENRKDLSVESYFGCARLWPWEIIYYRRLKKGPISAENYSRRITQNQEFGIVDRFIRGSSGWREPNKSNP